MYDTHITSLLILWVTINIFGETEITNFHDVVLRDEDVPGGKIAVENSPTSQVFHSASHLKAPAYQGTRRKLFQVVFLVIALQIRTPLRIVPTVEAGFFCG